MHRQSSLWHPRNALAPPEHALNLYRDLYLAIYASTVTVTVILTQKFISVLCRSWAPICHIKNHSKCYICHNPVYVCYYTHICIYQWKPASYHSNCHRQSPCFDNRNGRNGRYGYLDSAQWYWRCCSMDICTCLLITLTKFVKFMEQFGVHYWLWVSVQYHAPKKYMWNNCVYSIGHSKNRITYS